MSERKQENANQGDTMNVKQACEFLGISRRTLMYRIEHGEIKPLPHNPALKRPRRLEFNRADVERLASGPST